MIAVCCLCGKVFNRPLSRISKNWSFCTRDCWYKFRSENATTAVSCTVCGKDFLKSMSRSKRYVKHFCSLKCRTSVPLVEKHSDETKKKLREFRLGKGEGKTYQKMYGRHTHRVIAEQKLGRKLLPGEVVHHIDNNIHNSDSDNLMVFPSQKEHVEWHKLRGDLK